MTTYGELLDIATQDLATATVRALHPAASEDLHLTPAVTEVAAALAHLGAVIGPSEAAAHTLHARLRILADMPTPSSTRRTHPTGASADLADAAAALRTAADLLASHGPLPGEMTRRIFTHSEWTHPRPVELATRPVRAAGWAQLADLALMAADLTPATAHPDLVHAATAVSHAAASVPRDLTRQSALSTATPAWPLPLPRHPVPNEWSGRLSELAAIAWRMRQPPSAGHPHPVGALRAIAEIGYHLHHRAARQPTTPPGLATALDARASDWGRIHVCLRALHTPTVPLIGGHRWSLLRTRELAAVGDLSGPDLLTGQATLSVAAAHASAAVEQYALRPGVSLGPKIPPELRATREVRFAALHGRTIAVPVLVADRLAELLREASQPVSAHQRGPRTATSAVRVSPAAAALSAGRSTAGVGARRT